jgi:hypothetical protein
MLFRLSDPESRRQLEAFRVDYEKHYGPTDLTKRYTSTWPVDDQLWLIDYEPRHFFEGLPGFAKAWLKGKCAAAAGQGKLDDVPDEFLSLFLNSQMRLDKPQKGYPGW